MILPLTWLIKLLLSHLLSDFVLQPDQWIKERKKHHFKSVFLYVHTSIAGILACLLMGVEYWPYAIVIFITHTIIDGWKSYQPEKPKYFLIDQALHLAVIGICFLHAFYTWPEITAGWQLLITNPRVWIIATAFVLVTFPGGIVIGQLTRRWSDQLPGGQGLASAGKWIGIAERCIILIFLLHEQYGAIGLLITAKGLLRFSEKERQEEKTEYVLIGSLISVGFALLTGIVANYLLKQ